MKKEKFLKTVSVLPLLLLYIIICAVPVTAASAEACGLTVVAAYADTGIENAGISVWRVGEQSGDAYVFTGAFENAGLSPITAQTDEATFRDDAQRLRDLSSQNGIAPTAEIKTDAEGKAVAASLSYGVYLILADFSDVSGEKKYNALPSLVVLPEVEDGVRSDFVKVLLKIEEIPDEPTTDEPATTPDTPDGPDIPKTGQLWWPVLFAAPLGAVLLCIGLFGRKKPEAQSHEP